MYHLVLVEFFTTFDIDHMNFKPEIIDVVMLFFKIFGTHLGCSKEESNPINVDRELSTLLPMYTIKYEGIIDKNSNVVERINV